MLYRDAFGFVSKDEDNFNIVCGEFVIAINNNDNVSVTQYAPSSNVPQAYTVSSVDELPSNAVDGSSAFVSNNDIIGGWCINSQPNFIEEMDWYFNFTTINPDGDLLFMDNFYAESNEQIASLYYYSGETEYPVYYYNYDTPTTAKWISNGFRFITITSTPEDYAEQWVRTNAIKTKSLYTHENGQWVYKCEIV